MNVFDRWMERATRRIAQRSSRRSFLAGLGSLAVGVAGIPLLPVARALTGEGGGAFPQTTGDPLDPGDPTQCDYWRYCGFDGFLCTCCGGSVSQCPPGTSVSNVTWIGTCLNPADNKNYIISYNDCCGQGSCGLCLCNTNQGETPVYRPQLNNDIVWCFGATNMSYHCTIGAVLGTA